MAVKIGNSQSLTCLLYMTSAWKELTQASVNLLQDNQIIYLKKKKLKKIKNEIKILTKYAHFWFGLQLPLRHDVSYTV